MTFTLGFVLGCFAGATIGAFVMAVLTAGKFADIEHEREIDPYRH